MFEKTGDVAANSRSIYTQYIRMYMYNQITVNIQQRPPDTHTHTHTLHLLLFSSLIDGGNKENVYQFGNL